MGGTPAVQDEDACDALMLQRLSSHLLWLHTDREKIAICRKNIPTAEYSSKSRAEVLEGRGKQSERSTRECSCRYGCYGLWNGA